MKDHTPLIKQEETEREETNVVDLQLIRGGKPDILGKEPPTSNWLLELKKETVFLCKAKNSALWGLGEFEVINKIYYEPAKEWSVLLHSEKEGYNWVHPSRFINQFDLVGILHEPSE